MKRKNLMNDKVIKAITVGMAAMIAVTSTPVAALAEEVADADNTPASEESKEETPSEAAENSVSDAIDSDKVITEDVKEAVSIGEVVTNVPNGDSTIEVDLSAKIIAADKATQDLADAEAALIQATSALAEVEKYFTDKDSLAQITGSGFKEAVDANLAAYTAAVAVWGVDGPVIPEEMEEGEAKETLKRQKELFDAVKAVVIDRKWDSWNKVNTVDPVVEAAKNIKSEKEANEDIEAAYKEGEDLALKAKDEQDKANAAGEEATDIATETEEKFNELVENIATASTIGAANAAYSELVKTLDDAEADLDTKQKAYYAAEEAYSKLKTSYETEQQNLADAQEAFEEANAIYAKAVAEYGVANGEHTDKVDALNDYWTNLEKAQKNYKAAVEALENAQKKAEILSNAVNAAKTAILTDNASDLEIFDAVTLAKKSATGDNEDAVIKAVLKNIVLPKIDGIDEDSIKIADKFTKFSDDSCNYLKVTYTVGGETVTRYFNYVKANGTSDIIIFEKRANEIAAKEALNTNADATLYEELGVANVDGFVANGEEVNLSDTSVKMIGTKYYKTSATVEYIPKTEEVVLSDDEEIKTVTINNNIVEKALALRDVTDEEGNVVGQEVVKEYKADQTTLVYHKAELAGGGLNNEGYYSFASEDEAKAALKAEVGEDGELISSTIVTKDKYSGTVSSAFEKTISITGNTYTYGADGIWDRRIDNVEYSDSKKAAEESAKENASELINAKNGDIYNDGGTEYYVMDASSEAVTTSKYREIDRGIVVVFKGEVTATTVRTLTVAPLQTASIEKIKEMISVKLPKYDGISHGLGNDGYKDTLIKYLAEGGSLATDGFLYIRVNDNGTVSYVQGDKTTTTYGYEGEYWKKDSETTVDDTVIGETVYTDAQLVKGYVTQNKNNNDGTNIIDQSKLNINDSVLNDDEQALKDALGRGKDASALRAEYTRLAAEAEEAQADVETAQAKVKALGEIVNRARKDNNNQGVKEAHDLNVAGIVGNGAMSNLTLEQLEEFLAKAQGELDAAKQKVKDLKDQMSDVEDALRRRIAYLTPSGGEEPSDVATADVTPIVITATGIPVFPVVAGTPAAGVAGARRAVRTNVAGGEAVEAGEPTGAEIVANGVEQKVVADKETPEKIEKDTNLTRIEDEDVALAAIPEEAKKNMNWWWLVVVAVMGTAGYELYRRHELKKQAADGIANSINKKN